MERSETYEREERAEETYPTIEQVLARLTIGDAIPVHEIERLKGVSRDSVKYGLAVLALKTDVEREFRRRGLVVTVAQVDQAVVVHTEDSAHPHLKRKRRRHEKGMRKALRLRRGIDRGKMASENREDHDRETVLLGRLVAGQRDARRTPITPANPARKPVVRSKK